LFASSCSYSRVEILLFLTCARSSDGIKSANNRILVKSLSPMGLGCSLCLSASRTADVVRKVRKGILYFGPDGHVLFFSLERGSLVRMNQQVVWFVLVWFGVPSCGSAIARSLTRRIRDPRAV
ncbi:unnamed protein product, partial [Hapterophycus canaliculatus]